MQLGPTTYDRLFDRQVKPNLPEGKKFMVWLTHDVDRVNKHLMHALYYGLKDRKPLSHLRSLFAKNDPYWNFESIMELEDRYNARSTFFFLNESIRPKLTDRKSWILSFGRYNLHSKRIKDIINQVDNAGWEVGLHGSYNSYNDVDLLAREKEELEEIVGHPVLTSRQHYWNNEIPLTWEIHERLGLKYDATFVKRHDVGFNHGIIYPFKPFDSGFTVFPTALMEAYLLEKAGNDVSMAKDYIDALIDECRMHGSVLTVLWHQRLLNCVDFPEYNLLYEYLLSRVLEENGEFFIPTNRIT